MEAVPARAPAAGLDRVAANSAVGSLWTTVSRLTGLARVVVVAAVLGPTHFADLYAASNQLPNLAFELLTGALLISLVVPPVVRHLDGGRPDVAASLASRFLTLVVVAALAVVAVPVLAGPLVVEMLTASVPAEAEPTDDSAAWLLLALLMLQVPLYLVAGVGAAVQNASGRFAVAAAAPCVENLGIVLVLGGYALLFGSPDGPSPGLAEVALLGAGTTAAVLLHAAAQWLGAYRCGVRLRPLGGGRRDPEVRAMLHLVRPSLGNAAATAVRYLGVLVAAAAIPGGVVAFITAYAFYNVPVALAARPLAQATLPVLARAAQDGDESAFRETFRRTGSLVLLVGMPAAVAYVLLSGPLATAVAFGDMATDEGRAALRACLLGLGIGVVGECAVVLGTQAAYARRDGSSPLRAVLVRTVASVLGMVLALALLDGTTLLTAIALSVALGDLVAGALLWWAVARDPRSGGAAPPDRVARPRSPWWGVVVRPVVAGVAMAAAVSGVLLLLDEPARQPGAIALIVLAGTAGVLAYGAAHRVLRSPEILRLEAAVRTRTGGGRG